MANILEYTLTLNDKLTGELTKIGIANKKQLNVWNKVLQKVADTENAMIRCGASIGRLRERVAALRAMREWIPANNIKMIRRSNTEITSLEKQIRKLETASGGRMKTWFNNLKTSVPAIGALTNPYILLGKAINKVGDYIKASEGISENQIRAEARLTTVMRQQVQATDGEIDSIKKLASAQQAIGVIGDEVQLSGAQQIGQFVKRKDSIDMLLPAMNNLLAQQKGVNATEQDAVNIANFMGEALTGQTSALTQVGATFSKAQEKVLKYGTEAERASTLAQIITDNVGNMNEAIAATDEGKLKQYANNMINIQERVGKLFTQIKASLLPMFEAFGGILDGLVLWFETNSETIVGAVNLIAKAFGSALGFVGKVIGWVGSAFGWWHQKLSELNAPVTIITILIGSLATAMAIMTVKARAMALWSGIVTTAKWLWTAAQTALNLSMFANPVTWIIAGIVALIAIITYLCYKIEGWGSLWEAVLKFMWHAANAYVAWITLPFNTMVNSILIGIDSIMLGWYKFKEAVGMGNSAENQSAIAAINADVEARQKAIVDGAKSIFEHAQAAKDSLAGINMSWNSELSLSDIVGNFKQTLGIESPSVPGLKPIDDSTGNGNSGDSGGKAVEGIATGGNRNTSIVINLRSLVENIIYEGGFEGNRAQMETDLENALIRVLNAAYSAG